MRIVRSTDGSRPTPLRDEAGSKSKPPPHGVVELDFELTLEDAKKASKGYLLERFRITARGFWGAAGNGLAWPLSIALLC